MTTSDLREWLRAELAADREAIASKSPTDWLVTTLDTLLPLAVVVRLSVGSMVWAINHGKSAALNPSLRGPPIEAAAWSVGDSLQAGLLCAWVPAMVWYSPHAFVGPVVARAWLAVNAAVLVVEPARVGVRAMYDRLSPL